MRSVWRVVFDDGYECHIFATPETAWEQAQSLACHRAWFNETAVSGVVSVVQAREQMSAHEFYGKTKFIMNT
jgi:hypothetical protein